MLFLHVLALAVSVAAVAPQVELDYATYVGTANLNGVSQWLGLRFAASPVGDLRFAAPQDPIKEYDIQQADKHGPICIGTGAGPPTDTMNEDCLVLDVYAPSNATCESNLPVYFFIQGGGFNTNSNPNYNGAGLIEAAGHDMIVVTHNYRVGPWGFLAGEQILEGGSVNNGLKDQRKAMEWVQKYISQFGGDPKKVTMGGDSAGGQSVTLHITAYGGRDDGLFQAAAAESQSFPPLRTVSDSQFMYKGLAIRANCSGEVDTLACLRNLSATDLQAVNINQPYPGAQEAPLFMYGPTLDYDFISDYTYRAYAEGKFIKVPAIYGDDTNEGTVFVPVNTSSYPESDKFMQDQFPALTLAQLGRLRQLYPISNYPTQYPDKGTFWRQLADVYGEMRYICPGIYISRAYANYSIPNYNYHWNVIDPPQDAAGYGVTHTVEVSAIWGPENTNGNAPASYQYGGVNYPIVPVVQGYWTSFVRSVGDPNKYRLEGTPEWEEFTKGSGWDTRLMFQTNNTHTEDIPEAQLERCEYLWSIALELGQ